MKSKPAVKSTTKTTVKKGNGKMAMTKKNAVAITKKKKSGY